MDSRPKRRVTFAEITVFVFLIFILVGIFWPAPRRRNTDPSARAQRDLAELSTAITRYREDLGAYPPDDITLAGGSAENGMSEVLVHYLARSHQKDGCVYGPYVHIAKDQLADRHDDDFPEYNDPWGNLYLYAENASHEKPTGMNPKSFDLVSPGPDGELGGTISPATGYVPATSNEGKAQEKDNVTN